MNSPKQIKILLNANHSINPTIRSLKQQISSWFLQIKLSLCLYQCPALELCFRITIILRRNVLSFLIQEAEKQKQSPDTEHRSETTAQSSESQPAAPVSTSDCLKPVGFNNQADSASPERQGDRTDSEPEKKPVEQDLEQDTLIHQQLGSREASSAPAVAVEPGLTQKQGSCDGEEKRDQSKEEPPLEMKQQEG